MTIIINFERRKIMFGIGRWYKVCGIEREWVKDLREDIIIWESNGLEARISLTPFERRKMNKQMAEFNKRNGTNLKLIPV